jgi:hypothetical protein
MWKKTLGFASLAFLLLLTLQGCYSHHRAHGYRDDYRPGYVSVRVKTSHRHHSNRGYRVYHRDNGRDAWRRFQKSQHKRHYDDRERGHR